eukprot:5350421-Pyramimonas_sp.AAC.2
MGAAFAHGIRTGTYEVVQKALAPLHEKGPVSELQIQGFASGARPLRLAPSTPLLGRPIGPLQTGQNNVGLIMSAGSIMWV